MHRDPLEATPLEEYINSKGEEVPNPTPVAPPVGFVKAPSMVDHLRAMVRSELLRREVVAAGVESFDEADDFEIADDPLDPSTPYEAVFDPEAPANPERTPLEGGAPDAVPPTPAPAVVTAPPAAPAPLAAPSKTP